MKALNLTFASIAPNLCKYDRHWPDDGVCDAIRSSSKVRKMINWLIGAQRRSITQNHEQNHTPALEYRAQAKYELCPSLREDQPQFDYTWTRIVHGSDLSWTLILFNSQGLKDRKSYQHVSFFSQFYHFSQLCILPRHAESNNFPITKLTLCG